jgi:hypothetical protein
LPHDILREVARFFVQVYRPGVQYRSTGITLMELQDASTVQLDLFGVVREAQGIVEVFKNIDAISKKYGKHSVFLGSSFDAMKFGAHLGERGDTPERTETLFRGESSRRRLAIPMLGEVG